MQCERFERRLHQVLDERGRPEDDPSLRRHADSCPACRGMLASQQALWVGLAELEPPQPPADFVDCVLRNHADHASSVAKPPLAVPRRRALSFAPWAAAAAILIVPAIYWSYGLMFNSTATIAPSAGVAQDDIAPGETPAPESTPRPDGPPQDSREKVLVAEAPPSAQTLREEQYAELLERWRMQLAATSGRLGLTDAGAPTVQGAAAVSQLTDRLRTPLSASIESTMNVLRTALPSANAERSQSKPQARLYSFRIGNVA
jgi:hypothetical protein